MKEKNNMSDVELSLIAAISSLDNKLEELDHNISLLKKSLTVFFEFSITSPILK